MMQNWTKLMVVGNGVHSRVNLDNFSRQTEK
jgi:hypothetical protein